MSFFDGFVCNSPTLPVAYRMILPVIGTSPRDAAPTGDYAQPRRKTSPREKVRSWNDREAGLGHAAPTGDDAQDIK